MTVHRARVFALAAVLVGAALVPLAACTGAQQTPDEQQVPAEGEAAPIKADGKVRSIPPTLTTLLSMLILPLAGRGLNTRHCCR